MKKLLEDASVTTLGLFSFFNIIQHYKQREALTIFARLSHRQTNRESADVNCNQQKRIDKAGKPLFSFNCQIQFIATYKFDYI